MNDIWFVIFSTIEALSIYTIMLSIFRFNIFEYKKQVVPISILMSLLSLSIWRELDLSVYAPIISLVIFIVFIFYMLRVSLFGAALVVGTGYAAYAVVQTVLLAALQSIGFINLDAVQNNEPDLYILQTATAVILMPLSYFIFRKRYGFSFSLNRFSWRLENKLVLLVLVGTILFITAISLLKTQLYLASIVFLAIFCFLIYLSIRKEQT